jgi:hypothetical protein
MMNSPLMIGCNLRNIRPSTLDILKNREIIAINQDTLGIQAQVVSQREDCIVFARPVEVERGAIRAVALFNGTDSAQVMGVSFAEIQLEGSAKVRDLWAKADLGVFAASFETMVPAHGTAMLRIAGETVRDKTRYEAEDGYLNAYNPLSSAANARLERLVGGGYVVSRLGNSVDNWAEFRNVYSTTGGSYELTLHYYADAERDLSVIVNGAEQLMQGLCSGGKQQAAEARIVINLQPGNNIIRFTNPTGAAPDIDRFELAAIIL